MEPEGFFGKGCAQSPWKVLQASEDTGVFSCSKPFFHSPKRPLCLLRRFVGFQGDWDSGLYIVKFLQSCSGGSSKSAPAHPVFVYPAPVCLLLILQCALNVYFRSSEAAVSHIWLALRGAETISQPRKGLAVGDRRIENGFEPSPHFLVLMGLNITILPPVLLRTAVQYHFGLPTSLPLLIAYTSSITIWKEAFLFSIFALCSILFLL